MPAWLSDTLRLALGLGLLGGVFWLAFRRTPDKRSDGSEQTNSWGGDNLPPG